MGGDCVRVLGATCVQFEVSRVGKHIVLQHQRFVRLLFLITEMQTKKQAAIVVPPHLIVSPSPLWLK